MAGLAVVSFLAYFTSLCGAETKAPDPPLLPGILQQTPVQAVTPQPDEILPEVRGDHLMVHRQYQAAIDAYHLVPTPSAILWNKIGIAYEHLRAFDEAQVNYQRALRMDRNYAEALNNLGTVYYAKKDYRRAEKLYRQAMKRMPHSATVPKNLGTAYFAEAKFKQGAEAYRAAFAIDPQFAGEDPVQTIPEAAPPAERASRDYCIAQLFAQAGMQQRAIEYLRRAMDEGFADRKRVMQDQDFASLRTTREFAQLMAEQKLR